ncbi:MAG TPA: signal peptide peptidase SppA, partial [Candidatus Sulfotelmatobacter sp.]|nr:signal peptide peptidase SppA [Candidatus Sulfotelmatobacter sp.]
DFGLLARLTPQFKVSAVAQDILTTKSRIVPASLRVGFGYKPIGQVLLAADAELYHSQPNYGHLGLETVLVKGLTVRGGLDRGDPTAGVSFDLAAFTLDFGLIWPPGGDKVQRFEAGFKYSPERERPFSLVKPKEFVLLDISGMIKGGITEYSFFGGAAPGLDTILETIRSAAKDDSVDGILIRLGGFEGGLGGAAAVQEIRAELARAKAKGKKIVAYVEGSALGDEYYLASIADKIVAAPGSGIGGFGKSVAVYRFWGLFKKLGIDWQVISAGKYKTVFDSLSPDMTPAQKEMLESLVTDLYRNMLNDISADKRITIDKLKEIGDGMIFPARTAQMMGLVDKVGYFRDAAALSGELCGSKEEIKLIEPSQAEPEETFFGRVFGVAVIEVNGEIVLGSGGQNVLFGGSSVGSDKLLRDIRRASDDLFVKAILLRIDSPGGSAVAAGEVYQALKYAKEKGKTVIASFGSIAASGGYYIAMGADKIVADKSTITGSIGVIGYQPVFGELAKNWGVTAEVVKEGAHADMFSGLRKLSTVETQALERLQDEAYKDFVNAVAAGRKLATAEVEKLAQGKVYTGAQALDLKLVDQLGGFLDAVDLAKTEAKIAGEPRLIYYREESPFLQFGSGVSSALGLLPAFPRYRGSLLDRPSLISP